jgi:hypothetical protein
MKRSSLALLNKFLFGSRAGYAPSLAGGKSPSTPGAANEGEVSPEAMLAERSMYALKRLEKDVLVYRSVGDFEANGKLARVSYQDFRNNLKEVTTEVELMLSRLPQSKLKIELGNALASYREGEFWWQQINQPRLANVSALAGTASTGPSSDTARPSTVPYTVAVHWRQANRYLRRARQLMTQSGN